MFRPSPRVTNPTPAARAMVRSLSVFSEGENQSGGKSPSKPKTLP